MTNPTGYTPLDLVGFTDKGTYASNVAYVKNDIVHYAGSLYRCKIDDTTNITPGENTNWTVFIGEPSSLVERIIAPLEDNPATVAYEVGRQIIYDDYLWEVVAAIAVGDALVDYDVDPTNANIKKSDPVETQLLEVKARVGTLSSLLTTAKTSLVAAINEVVGSIGTLSSLTTTAKTSIVAAINEIVGNIGALTSLTTTAKTSAVAAINEVKTDTETNATAITATSQMIAPIETTLTASLAYAIGDQFIYNGLLYKATAAITQGGTITIDGNCSLADSVVKQINTMNSDTGWVRTNPTSATDLTQYRKFGNVVTVFVRLDQNNVANNTLIATLPSEVKPSFALDVANYSNNDFVHIDEDGKIIKRGNGSEWIKVLFCYNL